jgi:hypothetical protein
MSYVLFSQTSSANGQRNLWTNANSGESGAVTNAAVVGGVVTQVANSAFNVDAIVAGFGSGGAADFAADGVVVQANNRALYSLGDGDSSTDGFQLNGTLANHLSGLGNVLNAASGQTIDGSASNRTLDGVSSFVDGALNFGMADVNWNDIKNVEVYIASAETGDAITSLTLRSFVDARIKLGNEDGCRDIVDFRTIEERAAEGLGLFDVSIVDGKRGQIEGSEADVALNATIDVWTNDAGWQNSFSNTGSAFSDKFDINFGQLSVVRNISEFGTGAGQLVDANDLHYGTEGDQTSAYNGQLTTLFTNTGAGNDLYDATGGVSVIRNTTGGTMAVAGELRTTDYAWGGSGNDTIKGGGGNDFLFGDFGAVGSTGISQMEDPTLTKLFIGGSGNPEAWVNGTGVTLTAFNATNSQTTVFAESDVGNAAKRAVFDPTVHIEDRTGNGLQTTNNGPVDPTDKVVSEYLGGDVRLAAGLREPTEGLGVDTITRTEFNTGTENNNEVNAGLTDSNNGGTEGTTEPGAFDTLTVDLGRLSSAIDGRLTRFYGDEIVEAGGNRTDTLWGSETAVARFGLDADNDGKIDAGEQVGIVRFSAVTSSAAITMDGIVTGFRGQAIDPDNVNVGVAQRIGDNNGGWFDFVIETSGAFDLIEFSSGGYALINSAPATPSFVRDLDTVNGPTGDISDFRLRELCFTLAQTEGNDILEAGTGLDLLNGGGDLATVVRCATKGAEVLVNGGFDDTVAADAAQQEGGNWYLTNGGAAAGDGFGWSVADTLTQNIEIQKNGTGGLTPFAGTYKMELDSHPQAEARPLVSQTVATCDGGIYELTFAFAERQGPGDGSSSFELSWDGALVATFTKAGNATSWSVTDANGADGITASITLNNNTGWATAKIEGLVGDGSDAVGFQSVEGQPTQTNTYGGFIDSVSLKATYNSYVVTGGDRLNPGVDGVRDTIAFAQGDGFDIVTGFDSGLAATDDVIDLLGLLTVAGHEVAVVNGDLGLLLNFTDGLANGDDGRMFIAGVTTFSDLNFV